MKIEISFGITCIFVAGTVLLSTAFSWNLLRNRIFNSKIVCREPSVSETQWKELLQDILDMQRKVYTCLHSDTCYEVSLEFSYWFLLQVSYKFSSYLVAQKCKCISMHDVGCLLALLQVFIQIKNILLIHFIKSLAYQNGIIGYTYDPVISLLKFHSSVYKCL